MKKILTVFYSVIICMIIPLNSRTFHNKNTTLYSGSKIFVKTKTDLRISEATGKIMLETGIESLDRKISRYNVKEIRKVFNLNNGNPQLYEKYGMSRIYLFRLDDESENNIENITEAFASDSEIEFCEPVYIGVSAGVKERIKKHANDSVYFKKDPNDEMFYKQWYLSNNGSVDPSGGGYAKVGADIKMLKAWQIETGSEDVVVAILDSGIKDDNPDLKDRIWINTEEIPGNGIDDDYNGYTDDTKGWDFAYDDRRPEDGFGHGTNIATVIGAATDNRIGFAGINTKCRLMNCKNLDADNTGEYSWWAESIKYAVDNGAKIINMSEGGDDFSKVLELAVNYAIDSDVFVCAAMMNKGDGRDYYPASTPGVFAVGATDTDDSRCRKFSWGGGSCWGNHISVVAPGNRIYGLDYENDFNYDVYWSGTSQSTAIVSAIASLLITQDNSRSSGDVKKIIKLSSKDLVGDSREDTPGWDKYYGYGRVDCYSALTFENPEMKDLIDKQFENNVEFNSDVKEKSDIYEEYKPETQDVNPGKNKPARATERNNQKPGDDNESGPAKGN